MKKHNLKSFNSAVNYYQKKLKPYKKKSIMVAGDVKNKNAFFSIAPLSRAAHNLGCDLNVMFYKELKVLNALQRVWKTYKDLKKKHDNKATKALSAFIFEVEKKAKGNFERIFQEPDLIILAKQNGFENMSYKTAWHKPFLEKELRKTCRSIWKNVYNLKKTEKVGVAFELIPITKNLGLPLADYLDSYSISRAMIDTCPGQVGAGSTTSRMSSLEFSERVSELKATLLGCELEKEIHEPVFRKYKKLSKILRLSIIKPGDALFAISGKGSPGRHIFGECIGYPTNNRKSRWPSPGGIIYQLDWYPQTRLEKRKPMSRVGFTETLPVETFVSVADINYKSMRAKNWKIMALIDKSDYVKVESAKTNLTVYLKNKKGKRRARPSDSDVRHKINPLVKKRLKMESGMMANIPGGEAFLTPEYIEGTFYGDVVIAIDQSYRIPAGQPIVVKCNKKGHKIIKGPKKIVAKIKEKKKEAWKRILEYEKNKSLPKEIIKSKKKNFEGIGEFAINTHPTAKLCRYLIVNEKIAGMIHIALGSGFDADRQTDYHYDIVINAKKQKLDIYGVKGKKKYWILKKGKFVF